MGSKETKSAIGHETRYHPERDQTELRRRLKAELLTERIQREANSAPPLSVEQRAKIAAILLTGGDQEGG
jgi:hypothetical protein